MASLLSKIGAVQRVPTFDDDEARAQSACKGKHGFPTPQIASAISRRNKRPKAAPYRCNHCGLYHLGSI